ncbi:DUF2243 domain-containing protein [Crystallibacter degradans]|uniref:DUF2243 domain-containing protein n=1 Tax=Crystallibacter degradans TaxID=2726743 RepID=UPI001473019F|nr:DUF2243 domain-containing protein [Arthrobacter sp. SF27]NMR32068.1 DUF2243 domain-containing protein [Arthrobacter sp. SF27]
MTPPTSGTDRASVLRNKSYWSTFLIGLAVMAGVDEIVFHQVLAWHHFYDNATLQIGLLSDGLLHAAELVALVAGFFLLADARRRNSFSPITAWAGFFIGLGAFQLWDGIIDHKVLRLHQVRYDVEILPYDLAWNAFGLALLTAGILLTAVALRRHRTGG